MNKNKPFIVAHRGASRHEHENTLKSLEKAIEIGADYVECDIRKTKDGVFIIHHNKWVGASWTSRTTYSQLLEKSRKRGYHIPTLDDFIDIAKDKIKLAIEIQSESKGEELQIIEILLKKIHAENFVVISFHESVIDVIKKAHPHIRCGLLCHHFWEMIKVKHVVDRAKETKADFLLVTYPSLKSKLLEKAKKHGFPVWVWTVNNPQKIEKCLFMEDIQGILTDTPDTALKLMHT